MIMGQNGRYLPQTAHDHERAPRGVAGTPQGVAGTPRGLSTQAEVHSDLRLDCDTVIVGSGAGGATMAVELAEAGLDVIVLEEGGYHPTESFTAQSVRALRTLYRDGGGGMALGR